MSIVRSIITGCGAHLPERIVTNAELAGRLDTSDEWIVERTGIRQRHIAADGELTSDLAIRASEEALAAAAIKGSAIDAIVLATSTPDETMPATAARVQAAIGMHSGFAFDVQAVCSGFVYALAIADNFIRAGQAERVLVIGAETFSRIMDWEDRSTCVLFGDGAGAMVLEAGSGDGTSADRGILTSHLHSDGRQHDILYADGGVSSTRTAGFLRMRGREVFRHAVTNLSDVINETLEAAGLSAESIDWIVPHQANKRILDGTAKKFGISPDKVIVTIDKHANTSAASVPLAMKSALDGGRIKRGDLVLMEAMGAGLTWGAALVRW
jgi:3-oxoacyl-[acyl-carrier-protein] synthase-3